MREHSQTSSRRARLGLLAGVAATGLLAACGGDAGGGAASAEGQRAKLEEAALKTAECLRRHGLDVPDPKPGQGLILRESPAQDGSPATERRAMAACDKYLQDVSPPKLSEAKQEEMREAALAHSRCMRKQGIDFPDPTFGPDGSITIQIDKATDPDDPALRRAEKACAKTGFGLGAEPAP